METYPGVTVRQIYTGCLAQAAYYLESEGEAAVIDPMREAEPYLEIARNSSAKIRYVFETHFHADFVSGHVDLAQASGAEIVFGPGAVTGFPARVAHDREDFKFGSVRLRVLHTPGHTLESTCFLLIDAEGKEQALFTGDTLFLGDVGRPDLAVKSDLTKEQLADMLYRSLHTQILPLPDSVIVYPGHGAGSACGRHMSRETIGTLGEQKRINAALRQTDAETFRAEVLSGLSPAPGYFPLNARLNREGYSALTSEGEGAQALDPAAFRSEAAATGALVLDTRGPSEFTKGFIPGSINIGIDGTFASWAGTLLGDPLQPLLLVCEAGRNAETIARLARVGYQNVRGFLSGGYEAWITHGGESETVENLSAAAFLALPAALASSVHVLDVRRADEHQAGALEGSLSVPLAELNARMDRIPRSETLYIHCASGYRSVIAASILKARGYHRLVNIEGGYKAMEALMPSEARLAGGAH
jgi:glyoxylase-like metal-dependent hydrolase (beta-lactamase superfamily II)/rhodanese-related sulfurtransferase